MYVSWNELIPPQRNKTLSRGVPILRGAQYVSKRVNLSWWGNTVYAFLFRANRENNKLGSWNPCSKNYVALYQSNAKIMFYLINALKRAKEKKISIKNIFFRFRTPANSLTTSSATWPTLRFPPDLATPTFGSSSRPSLRWQSSYWYNKLNCISNKNLALVFLTGPANGDFLNILNLT
jgi:hypothetical protein